MNISKTKIAFFFIAMLLMLWFLYPRELFMAFIFEGRADLVKAENYYRDYLQKRPYNKFAMLRLAGLYERMSAPEKAIATLEDLYHYRRNDWDVARRYLEVLRYAGNEKEWFKQQLLVAEHFQAVPRFPRARVKDLLLEALDYALWWQDFAQVDRILDQIEKLKKKWGREFQETRIYLARAQKKMDEVVVYLRNMLARHPDDFSSREDLAGIYILQKKFSESLNLVEEGLKLAPQRHELLDLRYRIHFAQKNWPKALETLLAILAQPDPDTERRIHYLDDLAGLYGRQGELKKSLEVYELILSMGGSREQYLPDMAQICQEMKDHHRATRLWSEYLDLVPDDRAAWETLAGLYLYEIKDAACWDFYQEYLQKFSDAKFAADVLYFYQARGTKAVEMQKIFDVLLALFPRHLEILGAYVDFLSEQKKYEEALRQAKILLALKPRDAASLLRVAGLYQLNSDFKEAAIHYERLGRLRFNDLNTLKLVGRELFFLGQVDVALKYFDRALELDAHDAEIYFWEQEIFFYKLDRRRTRLMARQAVALFGLEASLDQEAKRMFLKSRARLKLDDGVMADYRELMRLVPKDSDLHADFIDVLLVDKRKNLAAGEIRHFKKQFPRLAPQMLPYEVRLAFLRRQWERAAGLLRQILIKEPLQIAYRQDLAYARLKQGRWREALGEYEELRRLNPDLVEVKKIITELHERHDQQLGADFSWADFGSDCFVTTGGLYRAFFGQHLETRAHFHFGDFDAQSVARHDQAYFGELRFDYHFKQGLSLGLGAGGGHSPARDIFTPAAYALWDPLDNLRLTAKGSWHALRVDFPQAVTQGVLSDQAQFAWASTWFEHLVLQGEYEWTRNLLPSGASSIGHRVEPSLSYILHKKQPYLSLGYQFSFLDHSNQGGFLNQVSLIPRRQAHLLLAHVSHDIDPHYRFEGGFFMGEDTARDLHFFEADLFGLNGKFVWRPLKWLKTELSYQYGRESFVGTSGNAHFLNLALFGHWL